MKVLPICALALICLLPVAAQAGSPKNTEEVQALLDKTNRIFTAETEPSESTLRAVIHDMKTLRDSDAYVQSPSRMQYWTLRFLYFAAYRVGEYDLGKNAVDEACTFAEAGDYDWLRRYFFDRKLRNHRDAAISLTKLAVKWPKALEDIRDRAISNTVTLAGELPDGKALKLHLLQALYDARWRPSEFSPDYADYSWQELVELYLDAGEIERAKTVAAAIVNPEAIQSMLSRKKFDAVTKGFDLDKAWDAALKQARARNADNPDKLEALLTLARRLHALDRQDEALALTEAALKRIADKSQKPFEDLEDNLNWLHNAHADVLFALGRDDEALEALETGAKVEESGTINVSQTLNLAIEYAMHSRPTDALKVLKRLDIDKTGVATDYGRMVYYNAKLIAQSQTGDGEAMAKARAFLDAHAGDAPTVAVEALLFLGDLDAAAKLTIAQLEDSQHQGDMLDSLQPGALAKLGRLSSQKQMLRERYRALRERLDVKQSIDSIGRILDLKTL